jgi:IS30 family transposase
LSVDNGKELRTTRRWIKRWAIQTYFADTHCIWQRGSYENFNVLLRQYIPKKRRMDTITAEVAIIKKKQKHLPRKRLRFKTPHEVFHASLNRAVRP